MLALRRRKTTSTGGSDADAVGSLRRTWTGNSISLRRRRLDQDDATMIHARGTDSPEGEEVAISTISMALGVLRDVAGALQTVPYAGAVAVVAVKVLEIREEVKDNVAGRTLRLVEALRSQAAPSSHPTLPSQELLRDLDRYERYVRSLASILSYPWIQA
jgi:hypothetical protein